MFDVIDELYWCSAWKGNYREWVGSGGGGGERGKVWKEDSVLVKPILVFILVTSWLSQKCVQRLVTWLKTTNCMTYNQLICIRVKTIAWSKCVLFATWWCNCVLGTGAIIRTQFYSVTEKRNAPLRTLLSLCGFSRSVNTSIEHVGEMAIWCTFLCLSRMNSIFFLYLHTNEDRLTLTVFSILCWN